MNCPHCDMFTPDHSTTCAACGKPVQQAGGGSGVPLPEDRMDFNRSPMKQSSSGPNVTVILIVVVVVGLAILGYFAMSKVGGSGGGGSSANAGGPGEEVDIEAMVVEGKTTVFDFYSDFCPPCRKISPMLEKLDDRREDIVVIKIDINRPGKRGIDWGSPVIKQYGIRSIPHFVIYDASGDKTQEGRAAYQVIGRLLYEEGIQ